jgi:hypothetical protein
MYKKEIDIVCISQLELVLWGETREDAPNPNSRRLPSTPLSVLSYPCVLLTHFVAAPYLYGVPAISVSTY